VSWHDVTVERIVSAIARRYKLTPVISEQLMSAEIDHADQTQESDMSFLTRMADLLGLLPPSKTVASVYPAGWWRQRERQSPAGVCDHPLQWRPAFLPHRRP
jgi:hypothetical protein